MPYSTKLINIILKAGGIPCSEEDMISPAQHEHFDVYYYPHTKLTENILLEDNIRYLLGSPKSANNRRVCFLLEKPENHYAAYAAIVIEYTGLNQNRMTQILNIHQRLTESERFSTTSLLQNSSLCTLLKAPYNQIRFWCLGHFNGVEEATIKNLAQKHNISAIGSQGLLHQNADIVFIQSLFSLLRFGKELAIVDAAAASKIHQAYCIAAWAQRLADMQKNPAEYQLIQSQLKILLKYALLIKHREQKIELNTTIEHLETLLANDKAIKKQIYSDPIEDIASYFKLLPFATVAQCLEYDNATLISKLQAASTQQYQEIKAWEKNIHDAIAQQKYSWTTYARWFSRKTLDRAYHYSYIGLMAELSQWFGQFVLDSLEHSRCNNFITATYTHFIPKMRLLQSCKAIGGTLGALFTYTSGGYFLARSAAVGYLSLQLKNYMQESIEDQKAEVIHYKRYITDPQTAIGLTSLAVACAETIYTGDLRYLIYALGTLGGSIGTIRFAKKMFTALQHSPETDDQKVILFFIAMLGYTMGFNFVFYSHQGLKKFLNRHELSNAFCDVMQEKHLSDCITDFSEQPASSFSFWSHAEDKVRLGWRDEFHRYSQECTIIPLPHDNEYKIACEEIILMEDTPSCEIALRNGL